MGEQSRGRVLGIGELLWDLFPDGPRLGGAPFNVIANLRRLGHTGGLVSAVGDDDLGRAALAEADGLGVDVTFVTTAPGLPTGTVAVTPDRLTGHRFDIRSPAAYESIGDGDALLDRLARWRSDALVFGTLAQRSAGVRELTRRVATEIRPAHRLYDVNLRDGCWTPSLVLDVLDDATVVKLNETEAAIVAGLLGTNAAVPGLAAALGARYGIEALCITRGAAGAALWMDGAECTTDALPISVADTVGAGDAFAAGLLHGLLTGRSPADTLAFANRLGALVASRRGALPVWRLDELA